MAKIIVHKDQFVVNEIEVPEDTSPRGEVFMIGRLETNAICLPSLRISKKHASLHVRGSKAFLTDLGSTNGCYVNNQRLGAHQEQEVGNNDYIELGPYRLSVELPASLEPEFATSAPKTAFFPRDGEAAATVQAMGSESMGAGEVLFVTQSGRSVQELPLGSGNVCIGQSADDTFQIPGPGPGITWARVFRTGGHFFVVVMADGLDVQLGLENIGCDDGPVELGNNQQLSMGGYTFTRGSLSQASAAAPPLAPQIPEHNPFADLDEPVSHTVQPRPADRTTAALLQGAGSLLDELDDDAAFHSADSQPAPWQPESPAPQPDSGFQDEPTAMLGGPPSFANAGSYGGTAMLSAVHPHDFADTEDEGQPKDYGDGTGRTKALNTPTHLEHAPRRSKVKVLIALFASLLVAATAVAMFVPEVRSKVLALFSNEPTPATPQPEPQGDPASPTTPETEPATTEPDTQSQPSPNATENPSEGPGARPGEQPAAAATPTDPVAPSTPATPSTDSPPANVEPETPTTEPASATVVAPPPSSDEPTDPQPGNTEAATNPVEPAADPSAATTPSTAETPSTTEAPGPVDEATAAATQPTPTEEPGSQTPPATPTESTAAVETGEPETASQPSPAATGQPTPPAAAPDQGVQIAVVLAESAVAAAVASAPQQPPTAPTEQPAEPAAVAEQPTEPTATQEQPAEQPAQPAEPTAPAEQPAQPAEPTAPAEQPAQPAEPAPGAEADAVAVARKALAAAQEAAAAAEAAASAAAEETAEGATEKATATSEGSPVPSTLEPTDNPNLFRHKQHGWLFARIPAGAFTMGSDQGQKDEQPPHEINLGTFFISVFEVSQGDYARFLQALADGADRNDFAYPLEPAEKDYTPGTDAPWAASLAFTGTQPPAGFGDRPVVLVDWFDAYAFCAWAGGSLPSEAQWERAAGFQPNAAPRTFPWGDRFEPGCAWMIEDVAGADLGSNAEARAWIDSVRSSPEGPPATRLQAVGSFAPGATTLGVHDMAGNVAEWCLDGYDPGFYAASAVDDPVNKPTLKDPRVIRGGSWASLVDDLRVAARGWLPPRERNDQVGFRMVIAE